MATTGTKRKRNQLCHVDIRLAAPRGSRFSRFYGVVMETILAFGILWVVCAILIVLLNDKWSTLALLALNVLIATFLLTENDLIGALVKAVLGIASPIIILLVIARTKQPRPRFGTVPLISAALLTLALSYLVAFSMQSQFPAGRITESYALVMLFGIAFLILVSQTSILKLLLG